MPEEPYPLRAFFGHLLPPELNLLVATCDDLVSPREIACAIQEGMTTSPPIEGIMMS